jgi:hypothetical protein
MNYTKKVDGKEVTHEAKTKDGRISRIKSKPYAVMGGLRMFRASVQFGGLQSHCGRVFVSLQAAKSYNEGLLGL